MLYLADRNILVDQSIQQDFAPLEKVIHKINVAKDDPTHRLAAAHYGEAGKAPASVRLFGVGVKRRYTYC